MTAGGLLKEWRGRLGLTQEAAAVLLEVSQASLSDYENGAAMPGADVAVRIEQRSAGSVPVSAWAAWAAKHRPNGSARAGAREKRMRSRARAG